MARSRSLTQHARTTSSSHTHTHPSTEGLAITLAAILKHLRLDVGSPRDYLVLLLTQVTLAHVHTKYSATRETLLLKISALAVYRFRGNSPVFFDSLASVLLSFCFHSIRSPPRESEEANMRDASAVKAALVRSVNPATLGGRVERVHYGRGATVVIEVEGLCADTFSACPELAAAGLEVKPSSLLDPRLIVHGVPVELTGDEIGECIRQDMPGTSPIKLVYLYPAGNKKQRSCLQGATRNPVALIVQASISLKCVPRRVCSNVLTASVLGSAITRTRPRIRTDVSCCARGLSRRPIQLIMDSATHTLFKVGHVNAQSLSEPCHFREVRSIMEHHEPHIMAVSESWLKTHISSCDVDVPGYVLLRHDRISRGCGGVALYVRSDLRCRCVASSERPGAYLLRPEFLFVLLDVGSVAILLGVVYSPPKAGFWSDVEEALLDVNVHYDRIILAGDFNINWTEQSSPRTTLSDFFDAFNITPVHFDPTHHVGTPHSTIDYICSSGLPCVSSCQIYRPIISKHDVFVGDV
ncbi:unnamed protein product [Trichogramma brassicae]|uniref:Endonuclease/exonuclease/phosphatase domain-containing protein n=1 Tax=Trichogramma brassicae TaxID=86971 RepID=A0A6H5J186_9HYME|nr:unnamed protein product [Trichogramma brassicae]